VDVLVDKKAEDVVLLDIQGLSPIADYFVICSGASERQIAAIAEAVETTLKPLGRLPLHVEGNHTSGWVLMDYSDVIIHVFGPQERAYYQLERLWEDARLVVHIQ
jgi:ribosome-associated protein